jgi:hypothetical protein
VSERHPNPDYDLRKLYLRRPEPVQTARATTLIQSNPARWIRLRLVKCMFAFLGAAVSTCLVMRLVLADGNSIGSLPNAASTALLGGILAATVFRFRWRIHPLLCSAAMGAATGIAGVGAYALILHTLASAVPLEWIAPSAK